MNTRDEVGEAEVKATGRRWCSQCQSTKFIEGGVKTARMWCCKNCTQKKREYMAKRKSQDN